MPESIDVKMARMEEQMKAVIQALEKAVQSRDRSDVALQAIATAVNNLDRRMEIVERQMTSQAPTIEEFITIKHKVVGAGFAGKWAWAFGGGLITVLYNSRELIRDFLNLQ